MKRKLLQNNALFIFLTIALLLSSVIVIFSIADSRNQKEFLREYMQIAKGHFDGSNGEETAALLKRANSSVRLEIVATSEVDDRFTGLPEILKLETIHTTVMDDQSYYVIATMDANHYLRLWVRLDSAGALYQNVLLVALISFLVVYFLSVLITRTFIKNTLQPLNYAIKKLSSLVDTHAVPQSEELEVLLSQLNQLYKQIVFRMDELKEEKNKLDFILDNINRGLVVIDPAGKVVMINSSATKIFDYSQDILHRHFLYLVRDIEIQNGITQTMSSVKPTIMEIRINRLIYNISIYPLQHGTPTREIKYGVVLLAQEVTELRKTEVMKREFFLNASHELKNPLTTILGYQQMISEGILSTPDEIHDATTRTVKEAQRMNQILGEMLELSKLESKIEVTQETLDIAEVLQESLDSYEHLMQEKELKVSVMLTSTIITMHTSHLTQLLNNVLDNAIKYNVKGGKLIVTLENNVLTVEDGGIGIAPEHQNRIFERFYRVDKGRSKDVGGTGLGLAIVKHIANMYKIQIDLTSRLQKGTKVKLTFPTRK